MPKIFLVDHINVIVYNLNISVCKVLMFYYILHVSYKKPLWVC